MPIEVALWRMDGDLKRIHSSPMGSENHLENILAKDISIVGPSLLLIGRQVPTSSGKFVDLLALDPDGNIVVLELKRDRTPREVVAQLLDYGSWARGLDADKINNIFGDYLTKYHPEHAGASLDKAFCERFNVEEIPETLNESHELTLVASELDDSSERIINYLYEEYGVAINAVFFRFFRDGDHEYLHRAWLIDPSAVEAKVEERREKLPWNGEFYVSFGHHHNGDGRHWDDARKYGFVSAGGGDWYTRTLTMLEPGARIWVNVPKLGYVGVGNVLEGPIAAGSFLVEDDSGRKVPITQIPLSGNLANPSYKEAGNEECVRVEWLKTVPLDEAIREKGLFGNQNSAAKPRTIKWSHTVERLKEYFNITD